MNLDDKIQQILAKKPGLKAREMATLLGVTRKVVNSVLYKMLNNSVVQDDAYRWWLKTTDIDNKSFRLTQNPIILNPQPDKEEELLPDFEEFPLPHNIEMLSNNVRKEVIYDNEEMEDDEIQNFKIPVNMYNSRYVLHDDEIFDNYRYCSLPYPTAAEERELWKNYIKWRHVKEILNLGRLHDDIPMEYTVIIFKVVEEISNSHNLVALLRRYAGLEKLGDIKGFTDDTTAVLGLYRNILDSKNQHSEKTTGEIGADCRLEDFLGYYFGEALNSVVFGRGKHHLLSKIVKATTHNPDIITDKLCELAVNRELLPKNIAKLVDPKTLLSELSYTLKNIDPTLFSKTILSDYQLYISNIRRDGEKAFDRIIGSHLRLVISKAEKYLNKGITLPFDDLVQEGSCGLIKATEKYNPAYGIRFMSHAPWLVERAISRAINDQSRTIRIPTHMVETIKLLEKTIRQLAQDIGHQPTIEEISEAMELPLEKVDEIIKLIRLPQSLGITHSEGANSYLGSLSGDDESESLNDAANRGELRDQISKLLCELTDRERKVLLLRFGLEDGRTRTLEEVGKEFKVTRERIRQIERKALIRLRHPSRSRKLKDFLG